MPISANDQSMDQKRGHLCDATKETLKTYGSLTGGWNSDFVRFPSSSDPWFDRGGRYNDGSLDGIFAFNRNNGNARSSHSSRIVISAP